MYIPAFIRVRRCNSDMFSIRLLLFPLAYMNRRFWIESELAVQNAKFMHLEHKQSRTALTELIASCGAFCQRMDKLINRSTRNSTNMADVDQSDRCTGHGAKSLTKIQWFYDSSRMFTLVRNQHSFGLSSYFLWVRVFWGWALFTSTSRMVSKHP